MPGPPPNPNAVRRNIRPGMTRLPSGGRTGRTPKWPLPDNPRLTAKVNIEMDLIEELEQKELDEDGLSRTDATKLTRARQRLVIAETERDVVRETEKVIWRELWRTPPACEWERLRWTRMVAQYVRCQAAGECGSLDDVKEARQRAESLGLTPSGLRKLMWVVDHDEVAARRDQQTASTGTEGRPARRRLAAVDPVSGGN